eukprot:tig00000802_g4257.t1
MNEEIQRLAGVFDLFGPGRGPSALAGIEAACPPLLGLGARRRRLVHFEKEEGISEGEYRDSASGAHYMGSLNAHKKKHGRGVLVEASGTFCGEFVEDVKHGEGIWISSADGSRFIGTWKEGRVQNGTWYSRLAGGEPTWIAGAFSRADRPVGICKWSGAGGISGSSEISAAGKLHGMTEICHANGTKCRLRLNNGILHGQQRRWTHNSVEILEYAKGVQVGTYIRRQFSGDVFVEPVGSGRGYWRLRDGCKYWGPFDYVKASVPQGVGTRLYPSGTLYAGPFEAGSREGAACCEVEPEGLVYVGPFGGDQRHGRGMHFDALGTGLAEDVAYDRGCLLSAAEQAPGPLDALVVGCSNYAYSPRLPHALHDAAAVALALRRLGFRVSFVADPTRERLLAAARRVRLRQRCERPAGPRAASTLLLYYAGHALEQGGDSFLLPVEYEHGGGSLGDLRAAAAPLRSLLALAGSIPELDPLRRTVVVLDSCRDSRRPDEPAGSRPVTLASLSRAPSGAGKENVPAAASSGSILLAFACAPGKTAFDGTGGHSVFTGQLLRCLAEEQRAWAKGGAAQPRSLRLRAFFSRVRDEVLAHSTGQEPEILDGLARLPNGSEDELVLPGDPLAERVRGAPGATDRARRPAHRRSRSDGLAVLGPLPSLPQEACGNIAAPVADVEPAGSSPPAPASPSKIKFVSPEQGRRLSTGAGAGPGGGSYQWLSWGPLMESEGDPEGSQDRSSRGRASPASLDSDGVPDI